MHGFNLSTTYPVEDGLYSAGWSPASSLICRCLSLESSASFLICALVDFFLCSSISLSDIQTKHAACQLSQPYQGGTLHLRRTVLVRLGGFLDCRDKIIKLLLSPLLVRETSLLQVRVVLLKELLLRRGELHGEVGAADGDGRSTIIGLRQREVPLFGRHRGKWATYPRSIFVHLQYFGAMFVRGSGQEIATNSMIAIA